MELAELQGAAEDNAAAARRRAGVDGDERPDLGVIADGLDVPFLPGELRELAGERARLRPARGAAPERVIYNQHETRARIQAFGAHEFGHRSDERDGVRSGPHRELYAWRYGAALLIPREPLERVWRRTRDVRAVIEHWSHLPAEFVARRLHEAGLADLWIVSEFLYVRNASSLEPLAREIARDVVACGLVALRESAERVACGHLEAMRLPDDWRRAAVWVG